MFSTLTSCALFAALLLVAGSDSNPDGQQPGGMQMAGRGASAVSCDRACLTELNTAYLDSLVARDPSRLATSAGVRFTENGQVLPLGEGLWRAARTLGSYRQDFAEVAAGQTAGFAALEDDAGPVLIAFRLKVVERKVSEIETTLCRTGQASFFVPQNLSARDPLYDMELEPALRLPRDKMIEIVDAYFQGLESGDGSKIAFAPGVMRNENGMITATETSISNLANFSYIEQIDRRYVLVDEERGNVLPWVLFQIPMGRTGARTLHLAELFKVSSGRITQILAIMVNQPLGTPSGWE
jgi:hypothetical protein